MCVHKAVSESASETLDNITRLRRRLYTQANLLDVQGNEKPIGETRVLEHRGHNFTSFFVPDAPLEIYK